MLGLRGMIQMNFMGKHFLFIMVSADGPRRTTVNFEIENLNFFGPIEECRNFAGNGKNAMFRSI